MIGDLQGVLFKHAVSRGSHLYLHDGCRLLLYWYKNLILLCGISYHNEGTQILIIAIIHNLNVIDSDY